MSGVCVSQIDFRNARFVSKIDTLAKILSNGTIIVTYFWFSNILQHFAVSFDPSTFHFTVGWYLFKGSVSFVSHRVR